MIIWTFQHVDILKNIENYGKHELTWDDFYIYSPYLRHENCYRELVNYFGFKNPPIWGYSKYYGELIDNNLDYFKDSCVHGKEKDHILIKLDVPDHSVGITSYYDWSDYLYYKNEEYDDNLAQLSWDNSFNITDDVDTIQTLISCIKREWILEIIELR